jgi:hypothetical protein
MRLWCVVLLGGLAAVCFGQRRPDVAAQREAMKKLAFLAGKWSGEALVMRGLGEPMKLQQTENVQYKLDGLVMLVEGASRNASGQTVFQALATISYDDAANTYHFRAYNDGRYLDTDLTVTPGGFAWGYSSGPVKVSNTMRLSDTGEWVETAETTFGSSPPRKSLEMTLKREQ